MLAIANISTRDWSKQNLNSNCKYSENCTPNILGKFQVHNVFLELNMYNNYEPLKLYPTFKCNRYIFSTRAQQ